MEQIAEKYLLKMKGEAYSFFLSALNVLQISSSENGIEEGIEIRSHWVEAA